MKPRTIRENVYLIGAVDWDRRLFDALIPLPDGTSYNAYFVVGSEKNALIDTVDPAKSATLLAQLTWSRTTRAAPRCCSTAIPSSRSSATRSAGRC